jgi:PPE-repeat protein
LKEKLMFLETTRITRFETARVPGHPADPSTGPTAPAQTAIDFGARPPEINSARMYSGPGSESMLTAAAAWDGLAAGLYDVAESCRSTTSTLAGGWQGTAAIAMTQATAPYIGWLTAAATKAEQTATLAQTAASAYGSAFAATVPPPVIDANRRLRISLASTNSLGHDSPAIADTDADYDQMWAQDADTMYAYAAASAAASAVTPFTSPPAPTSPAGPVHQGATQETISAASQLISALPEALQALSSSPITWSSAALSLVSAALSKLGPVARSLNFALYRIKPTSSWARGLSALLTNPGAGSGPTITAGIGRGTSIGTLSVPRGWVTTPRPSIVSVEFNGAGWDALPLRFREPAECRS